MQTNFTWQYHSFSLVRFFFYLMRVLSILFSKVDEGETGQWVLSEEVGSVKASAFVNSWAKTPNAISIITDRSHWNVPVYHGGKHVWMMNPNMVVTCEGRDTSLYVESSLRKDLTGFYVEVGKDVFQNGEFYMFPRGVCCAWQIGKDPASVDGIAYTDVDPTEEGVVPTMWDNKIWKVVFNGLWQVDERFVVLDSAGHYNKNESLDLLPCDLKGGFCSTSENGTTDSQEASTFNVLLSYNNAKQPVENSFTLLNGLRIPLIGLGTGAAPQSDIYMMVNNALEEGYRLLDSAYAYDNADIIGRAIIDSPTVQRDEIFIIDKVWYSHLGFKDTLQSVMVSLAKFQTTYLDSVLIHWPECNPAVEWMECEKTASKGTWRQTWRALEKMYAEGKVLSIGLSNFDRRLLEEVLDFAFTTPHIVQNYRDPIYNDAETVLACEEHKIFYQSYSSLRTLFSQSAEEFHRSGQPHYGQLREAVQLVAKRRKLTEAQVILLWHLQQGVGILPRSRDSTHLRQNMEILDVKLTGEELLFIDSIRLGNRSS